MSCFFFFFLCFFTRWPAAVFLFCVFSPFSSAVRDRHLPCVHTIAAAAADLHFCFAFFSPHHLDIPPPFAPSTGAPLALAPPPLPPPPPPLSPIAPPDRLSRFPERSSRRRRVPLRLKTQSSERAAPKVTPSPPPPPGSSRRKGFTSHWVASGLHPSGRVRGSGASAHQRKERRKNENGRGGGRVARWRPPGEVSWAPWGGGGRVLLRRVP